MFLTSNKTRKSTDLEGTPTPKLGPKQNGAKTPKSALKMQTPKKPGTPKKNTPNKNGARKSLAVNGSPKVDKTSNEEKTVAVKVEGAATNPASNKKRNRKRSLSEPGAQPAAKSPKLEKFAGTAALKSDTKEKEGQPKAPRNRSARRHQQFKDKKKSLAKTNRIQIKAKILEGDIDAQRDVQSKLDVLIAIAPDARTKSARRRIRKFQSWLKIKGKKGDESSKPSTVATKVSKAAQRKNRQQIKKELVAGTKTALKKEPQTQSDDEDDGSDEDLSVEGDSDMLSAESGDSDADMDSDEEDVSSKFIVDQKGQKPNQKPVNSKPQNKGKGFGKPFGNKKFAGQQKKTPLKK